MDMNPVQNLPIPQTQDPTQNNSCRHSIPTFLASFTPEMPFFSDSDANFVETLELGSSRIILASGEADKSVCLQSVLSDSAPFSRKGLYSASCYVVNMFSPACRKLRTLTFGTGTCVRALWSRNSQRPTHRWCIRRASPAQREIFSVWLGELFEQCKLTVTAACPAVDWAEKKAADQSHSLHHVLCLYTKSAREGFIHWTSLVVSH